MQDNQAIVTIAGTDFLVEASLGACKVYADEFFGKLKAPYRGALAEDMIALMNHQEDHLEPDDEAESGFTVVKGANALDTEMVEHLLDFVWAMARAAGSTDKTYQQWQDWMLHASVSFFEMGEAYQTIIHQLGDGATFRLTKGLADAVASDEG